MNPLGQLAAVALSLAGAPIALASGPCVELRGATEGSVARMTVVVEVLAEGPDLGDVRLEMVRDGKSFAWHPPCDDEDPDPTRFRCAVRIVHSGRWTLAAIAEDTSGSGATWTTLGFAIDRQRPSVAYSEPPGWRTEPFAVAVVVQDDDGLDLHAIETRLERDGRVVEVRREPDPTFDITTPGRYRIVTAATDRAGNSTKSELAVGLDCDLPQLKAESPALAPGWIPATSLGHLTGMIFDQHPHGVQATLSWGQETTVRDAAVQDPHPWIDGSIGAHWFLSDLPLGEGENRITLRPTDSAGQAGQSVTIRLQRDTIRPQVEFLEPAEGSRFAGSNDEIPILARIRDANLSHIQTIGGNYGTYGIPAVSPGQTELLAEGRWQLEHGINQLSIDAYDHAGLHTEAVLRVQLDAEVDRIRIDQPRPNSVFTVDRIEVTGTASDENGIAVTVNGRAARLSQDRFSASLRLGDGANDIEIVATDGVGNRRAGRLTVFRRRR